MNLYPGAEPAGLINNYTTNRHNTEDIHTFDVRVDHNFTSNDHFFARYSFSDNHKLRPSPFDGHADGGGFNQGDEKGGSTAWRLSYTHMFSSTLINEARFGLSREYINRLQPLGDDTSDMPGHYGIHGIPQVDGQRRPAGAAPIGDLSQLGHDDWLVAERLSNTVQLTDNLTKVYKSHTFKTGYMLPEDLLRLDAAALRARRVTSGRPATRRWSNVNDTSTARAHFLLSPITSTVPGGVDNLGGMPTNLTFRRSGSGRVQDLLRRLRAGQLARQPEADASTTACAGTGSAASRSAKRSRPTWCPARRRAILIPAEWRDMPLSASFVQNLQRTASTWSTPTSSAAGSARCRSNNFAPRLDSA